MRNRARSFRFNVRYFRSKLGSSRLRTPSSMSWEAAPPMVKMKRPRLPKPEPIGKRYVCGGCGYEYIPELGDPDGDIAPGTLFEKLPEDWVCPECAEPKDQFIEA